VLNEWIELSRQMVESARAAGRRHGLRYWERMQAEAEKQADAIRQVLSGAAGDPADQQLQEASE
jgi:hypothetical protein